MARLDGEDAHIPKQIHRKVVGVLVAPPIAVEDDGAALRRLHAVVLPNGRRHFSSRQVEHERIESGPATEEMRQVEETRTARCQGRVATT